MAEHTTESFYGAKAAFEAGKLTDLQWQTYQVLWHTGPAPKKEINDRAKGYFGEAARPLWAAQLKKLQAMGLVEEVAKDTWDVTSATAPLEYTPAKKPSGKKFKKGVEDIEMALVKAEHLGLASEEAKRVLEWLQSKL